MLSQVQSSRICDRWPLIGWEKRPWISHETEPVNQIETPTYACLDADLEALCCEVTALRSSTFLFKTSSAEKRAVGSTPEKNLLRFIFSPVIWL